MIPATQPTSLLPIPQDLKSLLPNPRTPWNVSSPLFNRVQANTSDKSFKLCEVLNTDSDFNFILRYFEHQKPPGYSIKRVVCIHNPDHTGLFELALKNMERESNNPVFAPKGKGEEPQVERARALTRWEQQVAQFSPVEIKSMTSRGTDTFSKARVLPLWHGSTKEVCQSICWSGFTSFGKHHYFDENASKGGTSSTDKGYFGSGIYFTNNAKYATMYSSEGHLLLVWVSMREPYPVVNDRPHPQKGSDMIKLGGKEHYQNYNAHFIPVASIRPQDPKCLEYYPCYKDQQPAWDEFVVFYPAQALPRFWVELGVDFPKVALSSLTHAGDLLSLLLSLVDKSGIKNNPSLASVLQAKIDRLLVLPETMPLDAEDDKFYKLAKRVLEGEKVNKSVVRLLLTNVSHVKASPSTPSPAESSIRHPIQKPLPSSPVARSEMPQLDVSPSPPIKDLSTGGSPLPSLAFGKEKWATYLGDVGEEPPLPPDIEKILKSPCPFFPGKKVEETHLLTLIPETVNGKPLTLNSLEELVKHPKKGSATQYNYYFNEIKDEYGEKPLQRLYWVLMTRDVIPESRRKGYEIQAKLLKELSQKAQMPYEVPQLLEAATSIFMEYLQTGERLYRDSPLTFTRCQERLSSHPTWPLVVGGFVAGGFRVRHSTDDYESYGVGGVRKFIQEKTKSEKELSPSLKNLTSKIVEKPTTIMDPSPDLNPPSSYPSGVSPVPSKPPSLSVAPLTRALSPLPAKPIFPAIAFGKMLWEKYIGDVGVEPPLPPDIDKILQSSCPFFAGKNVQETHLLTLIPKTVNGKPLTLTSLEELVKHPKKGSATKYTTYWFEIKKEYGDKPLQRSYWVLMTRDVIPESRRKGYEIQAKLLKELSQKAQMPYEIPQLLEAATSSSWNICGQERGCIAIARIPIPAVKSESLAILTGLWLLGALLRAASTSTTPSSTTPIMALRLCGSSRPLDIGTWALGKTCVFVPLVLS